MSLLPFSRAFLRNPLKCDITGESKQSRHIIKGAAANFAGKGLVHVYKNPNSMNTVHKDLV